MADEDELELHEGDVLAYSPSDTRCCEGLARVGARDDGTLIAIDTYWWAADPHVLTREELATAQVYFRASEFEAWKNHSLNHFPNLLVDFAEEDRRILHRWKGGTSEGYVRRGAVPDKEREIRKLHGDVRSRENDPTPERAKARSRVNESSLSSPAMTSALHPSTTRP